jgi:hypothetical protein
MEKKDEQKILEEKINLWNVSRIPCYIPSLLTGFGGSAIALGASIARNGIRVNFHFLTRNIVGRLEYAKARRYA